MKKWKILTASLLALTMGAVPILGTYAKSMDEAKEEKEELEDDLEETKKLIESLQGSKEDIQADVDKLETQLNQISGRLKDLEGQLEEKRSDIADTEAKLNEAQEKEQKQYESMKKRIQFMYENGTDSYLEILLSSDDFTEFINAAEYITQISQYDRKMLEEYQNTRETVAASKETLEQEYTSLQALDQKVKEEQKALTALEAAKEGELADLTEDLEDAEKVAKVYEAEIQAQNEIIAQIQAAQQQEQQEEATGSMLWPCPSSHRITSDYGPRQSPTNGASSNHKGIDIGAAYGADIVAADGGRVLVAAYSNSAGNYVILDHGGGLCTVYMHASSLLVSAGKTVSRGQVIAKVGSTGFSTGNHLHFGVTVNGTYVSPWGYVR